MSVILNIDTATDIAHISISKAGILLDSATNKEQKDHGSFLQPAIQTLLKKNFISIQELDAIAVSAGPGSYTGLRVGMASAKGLCFALQKPLITIGSLELIAYAAILEVGAQTDLTETIICPMIDARRMEVFTALYTPTMETLLEPKAMIIEQDSFSAQLTGNKIFFVGNGATKWELVCKNPNALFPQIESNTLAMNRLSFIKYEKKNFRDLAYSEPSYLKEFFDNSKPA